MRPQTTALLPLALKPSKQYSPRIAPTTEGEATTLKVQLSPAASVLPSEHVPGLTMKFPLKPEAEKPVKVKGSSPVFVSVTAFSVVVPTGTLPSVTTPGEKLNGAVLARLAGATVRTATAIVVRRMVVRMIPPDRFVTFDRNAGAAAAGFPFGSRLVTRRWRGPVRL
jgi:hypothetical protein